MTLNIVSEVWEAIKTHIDYSEKKDAAETLVNVLIDNGYDYPEIKESFRDKEILQALNYYNDDNQQSELDFDEELESDDEWD